MKGFDTSYPTSAYTDNPHAHRNGSLPKYKTEDAQCMQTYILQSWELDYFDDWQIDKKVQHIQVIWHQLLWT